MAESFRDGRHKGVWEIRTGAETAANPFPHVDKGRLPLENRILSLLEWTALR